jgi:hypothetical protein
LRIVSRATLLFSLCLVACGPPELRTVTENCPACQYVGEFRHASGSDDFGRSVQQAGVEASLEDGGGSLFSGDWHSVWLRYASGERKLILTVREADPGSGPLVHFRWSRDGQALFIHGAHSGINGSSGGTFQGLRVIYTLTDGRAWEVPNE